MYLQWVQYVQYAHESDEDSRNQVDESDPDPRRGYSRRRGSCEITDLAICGQCFNFSIIIIIIPIIAYIRPILSLRHGSTHRNRFLSHTINL